jgi:hypothetical protein
MRKRIGHVLLLWAMGSCFYKSAEYNKDLIVSSELVSSQLNYWDMRFDTSSEGLT